MSEAKGRVDKKEPLSIEEMTEATDLFMDRYQVVANRLGKLAKVPDVLAVMENVCNLGHYLRTKREVEQRLDKFGFNKTSSDK